MDKHNDDKTDHFTPSLIPSLLLEFQYYVQKNGRLKRVAMRLLLLFMWGNKQQTAANELL